MTQESKGRQERRKIGQEVRKKVPRTSLGVWEVPADRPDPVQVLADQDTLRLQDLVPIRYARMLSSEFAFYRGAAAIMAGDLCSSKNTHITVQMCGDAHLMNFGGYASPDRAFVFDVNDFDETLPGPFEFDLKRLTASFAVAGRSRGFDAATRAPIIAEVVKTYRTAVAEFAEMSRMDVWYSRLTAEDIEADWGSGKKYRKSFEKLVARAQTRTSAKAVQKLTVPGDPPRFSSNPPFLQPISELVDSDEQTELSKAIKTAMAGYRRSLQADHRALFSGFRLIDIARKVVGVGSVGTRCLVILLASENDESDVLMLQLKEAVPSVYESHLGAARSSSHGQRVVDGQRLMQAATDVLLGWTEVPEPDRRLDFYVRQMWDWKESADVESMDASGLRFYAQMCGWTLARAHCRSGDRVALAGYLGEDDALDRALVAFAEAYADQNAADYRAVQEAASAGRVKVAAKGW